ncbi:uncharacterized protein IL334_004736 [Kwoniella shivajii]|uniref:Uncharacterized protein n=1 Tax=Kwoniella shivajii TaxID=564305 RepID=A0ABZ1D164_9TREE|nr:hypothetical protein IL334_004736 [Kwoniella shivajii]
MSLRSVSPQSSTNSIPSTSSHRIQPQRVGRDKQPRNMSKHPYRTEFRERQGSESDESTGPYTSSPPRKSFFRRLTSFSCFEFDDSDPVARYRPKHEEIFGKNPIYRNQQIHPRNPEQARMIPSQNQNQVNSRAPNIFAGGTTGGSGTAGASAGAAAGCGGGGAS